MRTVHRGDDRQQPVMGHHHRQQDDREGDCGGRVPVRPAAVAAAPLLPNADTNACSRVAVLVGCADNVVQGLHAWCCGRPTGATAVRAGTFRQQLRQSRRVHRTPTSTTGRAETAAGACHVRRLGEIRRRGASARGVGRGSTPRRAAAASPLACHADPAPTAGAGRIFGDTTKGRSHTGPETGM